MKRFLQILSAFACGVCACLSWQLCNELCNEKIIVPRVKEQVPTIREVQQMVGAEPDGIIGKETLAKWSRAINNRHAAKYFERK